MVITIQKHQDVYENTIEMSRLWIMMLLLIFLVIFLRIYLSKKIGEMGDDGRTDVKIMVPLKYWSNFWTSFEIPVINCEINLILIWSVGCVIFNVAANRQNLQ